MRDKTAVLETLPVSAAALRKAYLAVVFLLGGSLIAIVLGFPLGYVACSFCACIPATL